MSLKPAARIAAAALVLSASACIPTMAKKDYLAQHLAPKASFDLGCPAEELKFTDLDSPRKTHFWTGKQNVAVEDIAKQQGASGCGKRGSYVYDNHQHVWLLNAGSESQGTSEQQAPANTQQGSTNL